jgi:hypothetical protein
MKNLIIFAFLGMFLTSISANTAAQYSSAQLALKVKASGLPAQIGQMSVSDFVEITPSQVKQITGQRLHFKEVVALKALQHTIKKELAKDGQSGNGKDQLVAIILVIFVGVLGVHRFYLGYPLIGVIQLLTIGGCGIWWLIDFFLIVFGSLKPSRGREYESTL